jgi:uncharacterized protein YccT (UPF0319 family)
MRQLATPFIVMLLAGLIAGCNRSPEVRLYEGPPKPATEVTIVRVPVELEVLSINGRRIDGLSTLFSAGYKDLHLEPGRYEVLAYYKDLWELDADAHDVIKSDPAIFVVEGEAGDFFRLAYDEPETVEDARELAKEFSGWTENMNSGDKTPTQQSNMAISRGLFSTVSGIAGAGPAVEQKQSASQPENSGNTVAPQEKAAPAPAAATAEPSSAEGETETQGEYLDMLKAYWSQATPEERRAFLRWMSEQK